MQLVVDANILFAALIKDGATIEILVNSSGRLFAPEFVLEEFREHEKEILKKTKRTPEEFESIFESLNEMINVIPKEEYQEMLAAAEKIAPDPDDVPYLALALKLGIPIWSNDKELKGQKRVKVYNTKELM